MVPISDLKPHPKNRNQHPPEQIDRLAKILAYQGCRAPIVVSEQSGRMVKGHGTLLALQRVHTAKEDLAPVTDVPVVFQSFDNEEQEYAFVQSDNAIAAWAELDLSGINQDVQALGPDFDIDLLGIKGFTVDVSDRADIDSGGSLVGKFGAPPFSILDTRQGYWQERKREWTDMGIKSEEGRDENLAESPDLPTYATNGNLKVAPGTSIFDPVLAEIMYRWFCPSGGLILDPFAGGSVRGVVASKLDRQYIGMDLREEQVEANREQAIEICQDPMPTWVTGDSRMIVSHCTGVQADLVFTCPPYADLEVYSDDERDISNMDYDQFIAAYREIIQQACTLLKQDRFAAIVVGDVRDKKTGHYRNFVAHTIDAFMSAGLSYYNEAVLVNSIGTAAFRASKQFNAGRKLVKVHQNVLVFVKGDAKAATLACGEIALENLPTDGTDSQYGEEL